ncbi:MAG TPA: LptF/LptG family permease [Gemmatimonadota bacterium]|nr:LptF/LptG family permease [Gemmatimonadota bacterium]
MRLLDRYVMGEFVRMLILSLVSLTAIFVLVHLMDHIDLYLDEGAPWAAIGKYYLYQTPYNLLLTMPMAMLVATILSLGELGRHGELTAMKASGVSLYRVVTPMIAFALLLSLGVLALGETLVPRLNERVNDVYEEEIRGEPPGRENFRGSFVYQNDDGYTYIVRSLFVEEGVLPDSLAPPSPEEARARQAAELAERRRAAGLEPEAAPDSPPGPEPEPEERELRPAVEASAEQVEIQRRFPDGTFLRINAPQMVWESASETWVLRRGELRLFPQGQEERMYGFSLLRSADLTDPPAELLAEEKEPEEMSYQDLREYIAKQERLGADTLTKQVDLAMKVSYPFANVVIALFGVALIGSASHLGRRGGGMGFGLALFLTIVFWGFLRVSQGIGYGGGLPPIAAAWLANGIFGVIGLALLSRAKT